MLLSEEINLIIKIFTVFAAQKYNSYFVFAEVLKLMLQYGKKAEAKTIINSFKNEEQKETLFGLFDFYDLKTANSNTSHIIKTGEALVNRIKDDKILAEVLRILGDAYRENGRHDDAVRLYNEAKIKASANNLDMIYMDCECALIDMEYVVGDLDAASNSLKKIKERIDFNNPNIYTYKYYRLLGHIFQFDNSVSESINAFNECLRIAKLLSFPLKQIETNNSLAEVQTDLNTGLEYLETARKSDKDANLNRLEYGKGFYIEAELLFKNNKTKEANTCADKAIMILEEVGYGSGCARSYLIKAEILFNEEKYQEALPYAQKAHDYFIRENIYPIFKTQAAGLIQKIQEKL